MTHKCKKCLLLEAGENKSYEQIKAYIDTLDDFVKVDENTYRQRLELCKVCDNLISGMCRKCGCYVEVRAVFKDKKCADYDNMKW